MHFLRTIILIISCISITLAQKPTLDNGVYKTWDEIKFYEISNNGKYAYYYYGTENSSFKLMVNGLERPYKREFEAADRAIFSNINNKLIISTSQGICILNLETDLLHTIKEATDLKYPRDGIDSLIAYKVNNQMVVKNIITLEENHYKNAHRIYFNNQGSAIALLNDSSFQLINLIQNTDRIIYRGLPVENLLFSEDGKSLAFTIRNNNGIDIMYYKDRMDSAICLVSSRNNFIKHGYFLGDDALEFSPDGSLLYFKLLKTQLDPEIKEATIPANINIWSYKDCFLKSQKTFDASLENIKKYTTVINLSNRLVTQLENSDTFLLDRTVRNNYQLLRNYTNSDDSYWNEKEKTMYGLLDIRGGQKKVISAAANSKNISLSPNELFVAWFDSQSKNYYCYEIKTGLIRNLTKDIGVPLFYKARASEINPFDRINWLDNGRFIVICDKYDVWQVDPLNIKNPVCLTGGIGRRLGITFKLVSNPREIAKTANEDSLVIAGLNETTKFNGLFKIKTGETNDIDTTGLEPCLYYYPGIFYENNLEVKKARYSNMYILTKQTATQSPNIIVTKDFKKIFYISNLAPQKKYNWMTATLVRWKISPNFTGTGILYKPENFDSTKRYPIIFHYYETKSTELFKFQAPKLSVGDLKIAWYVSNGYLVFVPDIIHSTGQPGLSALNIVVSCANYLSKTYSWIDSTKMGLQGHSYGGYETNFITTHSNIFAAAQSSSGVTNLISMFGSLDAVGKSRAAFVEIGQINMGVPPWQNMSLYIENSPIFSVDKITTPLLIMHNADDKAVPFSQSLEFYLSLRRLKKPVWLIQYDGEGHVLGNTQTALDFTIRQQQFFDHYLKNKQSEFWMNN
ncbi:alpha/beta hydrolase family protein [Chitinophaga ginsengisoli]|uniref:Prolyl oligopeptidase family protein n=1 Tax=Chitinophaga ginsengisoli TaxID=363837 RepID=A0A2P8GHU4_9BACT|nr:prolyl oligopeptidase family serine peptidase [Chitinophaga ginsengisoli]PSL33542.1 prolyl oligopeptidase family protein [Chitinophaga ginsengisoli]